MVDDDDDGEDEVKGDRSRSPAYPAISLEKALEYLRAIQAKQGHAFHVREVVAKHMGFNAMHGHARVSLSALLKYGLLEKQDGRKLGVSTLGQNILVPPPGPSSKASFLKDAALRPTIYSELWKLGNNQLPSDESLQYELANVRKFNPKFVPNIIKDFKATIKFAGLDSVDIMPNEAEAESKPPQGGVPLPATPKIEEVPEVLKESEARERFTLDEGAVILTWPNSLSADSVQELEYWLEGVLRRARRKAGLPSK